MSRPQFVDSSYQQSNYVVAWKHCALCSEKQTFKSPRQFCRHLRDFHCAKEGGSFVCRYGANGVCPSLPLEGVSDRDYEDHVARYHVAGHAGDISQQQGEGRMSSRENSSRESSRSSTPVAIGSHDQPSIVLDQTKWTIYLAKVNLPAVLNDPRLTRRETDFFTKTWGDSFNNPHIGASPYLPDITGDHFKKYLKKTGTRFKEHVKNANSFVPNQSNGEADGSEDYHFTQPRLRDNSRAELEVIPKIFMLPNFSLEVPATFNTVFPWTQVDGGRQTSQAVGHQSSKLLQEKLTHYLDLVEVQIARQIAQRSEAFFHAMTSHDKLQENMRQTCGAIKQLRDKIHTIDSSLVEGPLKIMRLEQHRTNCLALYNKLKLMSTVHQTQPTIQMLLATSEFVGALDLISTTQEVLVQELAGVHCFRHLGSQLAELEKVIEKMMQEDFVRYATEDLNRPLSEEDKVMEEDALPEMLSDSEERLVAIVYGMLRQHKINFIDMYREEACATLKAIIKQTVIEAVSEADGIDIEGTVGSLADQMRLLSYMQWMLLLDSVFQNLLVILKRVKGVVGVMQEVLLSAAGLDDRSGLFQSQSSTESEVLFSRSDSITRSPRLSVSTCMDGDVMVSQEEYGKTSNHLKDMLCEVCNHAHDRCVKLITARAKDGFIERLTSSEFMELSRRVEVFVCQCEGICGRKSTALRGSLQSQANKFVSRFHEERKIKLSLILDNERWKQADVPVEFQDLVDHISSTGQLSLPDRKTDLDRRHQDFLSIEGKKYAVVGTVLMLLKMMVEYCQCVDDMPSATPDILTRLVELLKMFNSRTCQLILGAGALQLVGLKTITTKNLALASSCLQVVVTYIPKVRQHFTDRLQGKQQNMLKHFEHILKDYNDHINELANKLVAIMDSMFDVQLAKWEVKPPMPSSCFRNLCKQVSKLHEALTSLLPQEQVLALFQRVNDCFVIHLRSQLIRLGVTNDGGPQHGLVMADVAFYTGSIKSLVGLRNLRDNMDNIWDKR